MLQWPGKLRRRLVGPLAQRPQSFGSEYFGPVGWLYRAGHLNTNALESYDLPEEKPMGRKNWLRKAEVAITSANPSQRLLRPAPMPAIEMAGFDSSFPARLPVIEMAGFGASPSSKPAVEMAGFGSRKYRPTVSRLIPNSFAIRRRDHPRWAKLYIVVCRLTLRTFDMPH